ncbi:MAG: ring,2-phenylacetyl-CoA epoxidase subunit PaaC [Actinomycetota bacterium]|jgi:ring-1,2-phenylacetyl-CoA epoxidase subunit PaaC|nr:ring,2-phenylacetyl-CoA epoxidase subunit PaaC [Actinomycetota bacterium]
MSEALVSLLTALADDELVIGHRHSEWTGFAPHLEEDVAFSSIAQDEIGHAAAYYSLVAGLTGGNADELALGRDRSDYRNAILCERPNDDWAYTLVRHWLYDHADALRLEALEGSADENLAAVATKIRREERYHVIHADSWMKRVAHGPVEGRTKLSDAMGRAFPETLGLFEPFELESDAVKQGWLPVPSDELRARFFDKVRGSLDDLGLPTEIHAHAAAQAEFVASSSGDLISAEDATAATAGSEDALGGRKGRHTQDFSDLWDAMTTQYRSNPGATW